MDDLPFVIYSYFVLHTFCEINQESLVDEVVSNSMEYDRSFQPQATERGQGANDSEGKRVRRVLAAYFDP